MLGFQKVCEIFQIWGIWSLKYVRELYTPVCYCGDMSKSVKRLNGRALTNERSHLFQTFSRQSEGLAMQD